MDNKQTCSVNFIENLEAKEQLTHIERKVLQQVKSNESRSYYKLAFSILKQGLNKELTLEDRMKAVNKLFEHKLFDVIKEYTNHWKYGLYNGILKKGMPLYSESHFALTLSNIAWYLLQSFASKDGLLSDEAIERQASSNRIIGIDETYDNESQDAVRGLEMNIDLLEKYIDGSFVSRGLSEEKLRELRNKSVMDNLEKYDELKEHYTSYIEFGLTYGFDKGLGIDEKANIKNLWIEQFGKEGGIYSPKQRYTMLNKMYNQLGTDIARVNDILRKSVMSKKTKQVFVSKDANDHPESIVLDLVNLCDIDHVNGLLTIQYDSSIRKYFPLYKLIKEKYKGTDSKFQIIEEELKDTIRLADLSNEDIDIIKLIIGEHDVNLYDGLLDNVNPYPLIVEYINSTYGKNYTVGKLKSIVSNRIVRNITETYIDLEDGVGMKKCTSCGEEKLGSKNNFGQDKRNKSDGLKSACRACEAKNIREKRNIC